MSINKERWTTCTCVALALVGLGLAPTARAEEPPAQVESALNEMPDMWFVELASPPTEDGTDDATLTRERDAFRSAAIDAGVDYSERKSYRRLWNGLTLRANRSEMDKVRKLPGVKAVYPVFEARIEAEAENSGTDLATALAMTGADVAQNTLGLSGDGVKVAVMDTGIDYNHPDLEACFGPGCRVRRGHDFVGDAFNANLGTTPVPDSDPDDCAGHGTHVAGIIGANGAVTGVAPNVTFFAYRVFGCAGTTTSDIMLDAMERALDDGADILNMSIGASFQWPRYPTAQGADRLARKGMVVVASIGNSGASGLYSASAPAVGDRVIGVAAFDNTHLIQPAFSIGDGGKKIGYSPATGAPLPPTTGSLPLARTGTPASTADGCASLPAGSLAGRAVLIRRGTCGFYIKATNAQNAGALAVVLYNNVDGFVSPTVAPTPPSAPPVTIPVVAVTAADGVTIDGRLALGAVTLTWTADLVSAPNPTGGLISSFSSSGLAPDLGLKPDIGAPGGSIRSTYPLELGGHAYISGTSMASPHVAGAAALYLEAHPRVSVGKVRDVLQNYAVPAAAVAIPGSLEVVHRQGAGMLRIDAAIQGDGQVRPGKLAFGEFKAGAATQKKDTITIRNRGCNTVTYTLGHAPALATGANTFVPTFLVAPATVTFSKTSVKLRADEDREITVKISGPTDPNARLFGGYITFTPSDGSAVLRVPYAGYNGDYQAIQALVPTANGFPWLAKLIGTSFFRQPAEGAEFTMVGDDVPYVLLHLDHQVENLRMEVVAADADADADDDADRDHHDHRRCRHNHRDTRRYAVDDDFLGRNSGPATFFAYAWDGTTFRKDGNKVQEVPDGTYTIVLTAKKALGDRKNAAHVETWTSPPITIDRP